MIQGKKIIGLIAARGGSKGVPKKNIKPLLGSPLIKWTINEAKKSKYIDRLILSSDNEEIISVAKDCGLEVPFIRPAELAKDETIPMDVFIHAIEQCPGYDFIVVLQPTSPLRIVDDIDKAILKIVDTGAPACVSMTIPDKNPYWMFKINDEGSLISLFPDKALAANRQDLPLVYAPNGAIFVSKTNFLLKNKSFFCPGTVPYMMPRIRSIDIDEEIDFLLAEALLKEYKYPLLS